MNDKEYFESLVISVGQWSEYNFGDQNGLDHLAPLFGIHEEVGEYYDSLFGQKVDAEENVESVTAQMDAKCDLFIYYCDYLYRSGDEFFRYNDLDFSPPDTDSCEKELILDIFVALSKLYHIELKRVQGIRKFADDNFYYEMKKKAVRELHRRIMNFVYPYEEFKQSLDRVWKYVVSKRNWRLNKDG